MWLQCVDFKRTWEFQWISKVPYCLVFVLFKESKLKVANYRVVNQNTVYVLHQGKFGVNRTKSRIIQFISSFNFGIHLKHVFVKSTIVVHVLFWVFQILMGYIWLEIHHGIFYVEHAINPSWTMHVLMFASQASDT